MKARIKNLTHKISIRGNGGYNNQSGLTLGFGFPDTELVVPDPWDLGSHEGKHVIDWELSIPSGNLYSIGEVTWEFDHEADSITLSAPEGIWDGKRAGLLGGMSGFGEFYFDSISEVQEGVFVLPEDNNSVPYKEYLLRHYRMLGAFLDVSYEDEPSEGSCQERAARVSAINRGEYVGESHQDELNLWYSDIRRVMALPETEFRELCLRRLIDNIKLDDRFFRLADSSMEKIIREFPEFEGLTLYGRQYHILPEDEAINQPSLSCWIIASGELMEAIPPSSGLNDLLEKDRYEYLCGQRQSKTRRGRTSR